MCQLCGNPYKATSMKRHIKSKHAQFASAFTPTGQLPAVLVDSSQGIYMVARTFRGTQKPIHVQFHTRPDTGETNMLCESPDCLKLASLNEGRQTMICQHMAAFPKAKQAEEQDPLSVKVLNEICDAGIITRDRVNELMETVTELAPLCSTCPLAFYWCPNRFTVNHAYVSICEPEVRPYARLKRVVVALNFSIVPFHIKCDCTFKSDSTNCIHCYIALWRIVQERPELLTEFVKHLVLKDYKPPESMEVEEELLTEVIAVEEDSQQ
jgi:hypothetical protein